MTSRDVVRRIRAFAEGAPIPLGDTKRVAVVDDANLLVVVFLRMGGEARPWGIAFGLPNEAPTVLSVPEGRNRDLVSSMVAEFAPTLLKHLRTPGYVAEDPTSWEELAPLHQIWVPNTSHLDMFHNLAYAYTFTKWGAGRLALLNPIGHASGWLFREAQRAGQQTVVSASSALKDAYTFPAQDIQQGHLGFLLAWLHADGDRDTRLHAARAAERTSVSTSLDPSVERDEIEAALDAWNAASDDEQQLADAHALAIAEVLDRELRRRFDLTVDAIRQLRNDQRRYNAGLQPLINESLKEQWYQYTRMELRWNSEDDGPAFVASPETDRYPAAAASRYQVYIASEEQLYSALLHDDREMQVEAIARGEAFVGMITDVRDDSPGRKTTPVWTIRADGSSQNRLREGSWVCVVDTPKRTGRILTVADQSDGSRVFEVEITGWKTKPAAAAADVMAATDTRYEGTIVTFVKNSAEGINRLKSQRIWSADGPGAWLTHARPQGPRSRLPEDTAEDLEGLQPIGAAGV